MELSERFNGVHTCGLVKASVQHRLDPGSTTAIKCQPWPRELCIINIQSLSVLFVWKPGSHILSMLWKLKDWLLQYMGLPLKTFQKLVFQSTLACLLAGRNIFQCSNQLQGLIMTFQDQVKVLFLTLLFWEGFRKMREQRNIFWILVGWNVYFLF